DLDPAQLPPSLCPYIRGPYAAELWTVRQDTFGYTSEYMPKYNSISISGYDVQEAGAWNLRLRLPETKKNCDEAVAQECLNRLIHSAKLTESTGPGTNEFNLLKLAVAAARARCTVGEISDALETIWGRHVPKSSVVTGAYRDTFLGTEAEGEYNNVLAEVELFAERQGRRPRLLVAKMGQDGHDRGAKVIASGFSDLGFDTPEEVARQAVDSDVHCVGVSSQVGRETHAAGHNTLVPALMQALKDQGAEHILVICGGVIPPKDYDFLYEQGVGAIFGPGTRLPTAAHDTLQAIYKKIKQNEQSNNA
ncbi:hypothetical protein DYB30_009520, partial [Aphanomyces astaci]